MLQTQTPLVASLQRVLGSAQVIETHISWVLLAGGEAWKIKKPVDLGFVDFTTLQRREFFCREELRLNRRLAPELYLGVVPISGTPDDPQPFGDGEPIEFAVRMREFPQEMLLARVLQRGELQLRHIDHLAAEIAAFHARIDVAAAETPFGAPAGVWSPVEENFRHVLRIAEHVPALAALRGRLHELRELSRGDFDRLRETFAKRKREGWIRECHGDMHLGNMILDGDDVVIFDCIEFNAALRWIDVASEVAFAVMDLEDRGRPDFANRLLDGWLTASGDYDAIAVLPFYRSYRAMVRAKVAALRIEQTEEGESGGDSQTQADELRWELDSYLALAKRSLEPRQRFLLLTHGASGSGKTTGTQRVVEDLGAIRVRSDVERKRLCGLAPLESSASGAGTGIYTAEVTEQTSRKLGELAEALLHAGVPVVVDATFLERSRRDGFRRLADRLGVPFFIADFRAEPDVLRARVAERSHRGGDASEADRDVLERQLAHAEPLGDDEQIRVLAVDAGTKDAAQALADSLQRELGRLGDMRP
ncbi:MAG: AAA family ATPase [Planctomycetes bacterium]|nr:AAA family ATPase [Planctomycetota bacterium]